METICNNFQEFLKADDAYHRYMEMVFEQQVPYITRYGGIGQNKDDREAFSHFLYTYTITTIEGLKEAKTWQNGTEVFRDIVDEVIENFGKPFSKGILTGLEITEEDCYYLFDNNGIINSDTCCDDLE